MIQIPWIGHCYSSGIVQSPNELTVISTAQSINELSYLLHYILLTSKIITIIPYMAKLNVGWVHSASMDTRLSSNEMTTIFSQVSDMCSTHTDFMLHLLLIIIHFFKTDWLSYCRIAIPHTECLSCGRQ